MAVTQGQNAITLLERPPLLRAGLAAEQCPADRHSTYTFFHVFTQWFGRDSTRTITATTT